MQQPQIILSIAKFDNTIIKLVKSFMTCPRLCMDILVWMDCNNSEGIGNKLCCLYKTWRNKACVPLNIKINNCGPEVASGKNRNVATFIKVV